MKIKNCWTYLLIIISTGCAQQSNKEFKNETPISQGKEIVLASIGRHGGNETWNNLKEISYKKTFLLFDSLGAQESSTTQYHRYQLMPDLQGSIEWISNGDSISIKFKRREATCYVNGEALLDSASRISSDNTAKAALFVLFQPFKLLESGVELSYLGIDTLSNGRVVDVIQPTFGKLKEGDDIWWFYFDVETKELVANMVKHLDHHSYIENLKFDTSLPLTFHAHRKSYFTDNLRNVNYLRAEYFYEDFEFVMKD